VIQTFLCQNKERELTRDEIHKKLELDISDHELEKRMHALVMSDIVKQGSTNFDFQDIFSFYQS